MQYIQDIPEDLMIELVEYIKTRDLKIKEMKDQGIDVASEFLKSEQDNLGRLLKPSID